jgi:hypothetical protein
MSTQSRKVEKKMNCRRCSSEVVNPYSFSFSNAATPSTSTLQDPTSNHYRIVAVVQHITSVDAHKNHIPLCTFPLAAVPKRLASCRLTIPLFSLSLPCTYVSTGGKGAYPLFVLLTLVWKVVPVLVLDSTGQDEAVASVLVASLMGGVQYE